MTKTYYRFILSVLPLNLKMDVKSSMELEDKYKDYDYIILAPQLDYELDQLEKIMEIK